MSQPKRYSLWSDEWGIEQSEMVETDNGGWITYSDYAAIAAENERLNRILKPLLQSVVPFDDYVLVLSENKRLRKAGEWQSKDTIPKEGVDVLCWSGDFMFVGWVNQYGTWHSSDDSRFVPDCWMPLPKPPAKEGRDAK